jgi:hypothetical protein
MPSGELDDDAVGRNHFLKEEGRAALKSGEVNVQGQEKGHRPPRGFTASEMHSQYPQEDQ